MDEHKDPARVANWIVVCGNISCNWMGLVKQAIRARYAKTSPVFACPKCQAVIEATKWMTEWHEKIATNDNHY